MELCFGGAVPANGNSEIGPSQKEDRLNCWTGSGLVKYMTPSNIKGVLSTQSQPRT